MPGPSAAFPLCRGSATPRRASPRLRRIHPARHPSRTPAARRRERSAARRRRTAAAERAAAERGARPRRRPRGAARPAELGRGRRALAARARHPPRGGRLPPRADQLRQDLRVAAGAGRDRLAASTPRRCASSRTRPTPSSPPSCPPGTVGLSTGEEEIDPHAPIVCCTVEKAPMRGELLVLDESHWVADPDRGHHWARLLLTGEYREMHLISAAEAYLLLKPLVADAKQITVVNHKRLSRLDVLRAPVRAGQRAAADARRRVLPQDRLRRRRRARPAPARQGRRPLRRPAAGHPPRGDREVHRRRARGAGHHRRHRARHQRAGHDRAVRRDDEVRRRRGAPAAHLGDRPDRRPRGPLRAHRARRGRRARRGQGPQARRRGCWSPAPPSPAATRSATCPSARRGCAPSSTTSAPSSRSTCPRRSPAGWRGRGPPPATRR